MSSTHRCTIKTGEERPLNSNNGLCRKQHVRWDGSECALSIQIKDDDIGDQALDVGSNISWRFENEGFGSTLFWCDLAANDHKRLSFDAYNGAATKLRDMNNVRWFVKDDGVYLLNRYGNGIQEKYLGGNWH
ncbi:unnamed protein product [Linum tenue]|uniref:S-protein homolog n=1 Tax=Linum tenue TaxID=586396 RepID=A0AAV0IIV9_9ROSI|nr:unnamed protein product [Linum tenue]